MTIYPKLQALLLCSIFCITACLAGEPATPGMQWTQDSVSGLAIELINPTAVESMSFDANGYAPVTIGRRNGPLTGPLFQWKLVEGRLQIYDGQQVYEELTLVSRDASTIVARRRNGQTAKYKILAK